MDSLTNTLAQKNPGQFTFVVADGVYDIVINENLGDDKTVLANESIKGKDIYNFKTLIDAVSSKSIKVGDIIFLKERTTGDGGGSSWDVVLASTVTINTFDIVASTGVVSPTALAFVLQSVDGVYSVRAMGSDHLAINHAYATFNSVEMGDHDYTTTAKVNITRGLNIFSSGAKILKNYDGVGLELTNGADTVYFFGELSIEGSGAFAGTGLTASTSASAHGIEIINSRIRVIDVLRGDKNIGDGVRITSAGSGNANKCDFNELRATNNNGKGIRCVGTSDDQSVWRIGWYTQNNYNGGVHLDTDYTGRQWVGFIYNEGSAGDGVADGVFLGRLRACGDLAIYSEEQSTTGTELVIDTACSDVRIEGLRANSTTNNSPGSCTTWSGGTQRLFGSTTNMGRISNPNMNDAGDSATREFLGGSNNVIVKEKFRGDGAHEIQAIIFGGTQQLNNRTHYAKLEREAFGTSLEEWNFSASGTEAVPVNKVVGEFVYKQFSFIRVGGAYHTSGEIAYEITSTGGGAKASYDMIYKLTPNGSSSRIEVFRISQDGNIKLSVAGKGIEVVSPDGLTTKTIGIDNAGNLLLS